MSWYQTVGKAIAGTTSVAGVITATPVFGEKGTITPSGIVVSALIGTSAALLDQLTQSTCSIDLVMKPNECNDEQ
ncbi:hypothetical protein [Vibrio diabolicus]